MALVLLRPIRLVTAEKPENYASSWIHYAKQFMQSLLRTGFLGLIGLCGIFERDRDIWTVLL